ncbi:hypothetical protein HPB48_019205 [Haemaphysalis longicornis]|uniref:Uncharacterized protein n=1 Tax=Haemaphysalis longicornis TaxID=44386 RepID=A0A9J6GQW5_HAELO|nr:hypothetical protein HPB48_019205 [Haemaphysalis longicornis]
MCGDVELNPGPNSDSSDLPVDLSAAVKADTQHVDVRHDELKRILDDVKSSQETLERTVVDITARLVAAETKIASLDISSGPIMRQAVADAVHSENAELRSRLNDLEDRSRRENLLFYGMTDCRTETWAQTETSISTFLSSTFELSVPENGIARAHRLGSFVPNKYWPIIVKFHSSKLKDSILANRKKSKNSRVTVAEDFCKETHHSRKKLIEFGKASGEQYSLRYNKLLIDKKCFVHCAQTDRVCEINLSVHTVSTSAATPPHSPRENASL